MFEILFLGTSASAPSANRGLSSLIAIHDHWLLDPSQVVYRTSTEVLTGIQEARLGSPHIDRVWWQICRSVQGCSKGSWRDLIRENNDNANTLLGYLQKSQTPFPVLSGTVISARRLDLVHRIGQMILYD